MIVGQDWGDTRAFQAQRGLDDLHNPVLCTLEKLLVAAGFDVQMDGYGQGPRGLFLTNAVLCLRKADAQPRFKDCWFLNCGERFLRPQIDLVAPRVVATLGQRAHESVLRAYGLQPGRFRDAVELQDGSELPNGIRLFAMYHCGNLVTNTRRSYEEQVADWRRIRSRLDTCGIGWQRSPLESFVDPGTGWAVTRQRRINPVSHAELMCETITDPLSGETSTSIGLSQKPRDVATWVREIGNWKAGAAEAAREQTENLHRLYPELAAGADVPHGPLGLLKLRFAESFAAWSIGLPDDDVVCRRRGSISVAGWSISYLFGSDEKGEYLDYYSQHRMTSDSHMRLYADGRVEGLPAMQDLRLCSEDPVEDERLKAEYFDHNHRIGEMLREKGF